MTVDNLLHRVLVKKDISNRWRRFHWCFNLVKILSYVPKVVHVVDRDENALARDT